MRFFTIWNESNLATFLVPQFNARGKIVSPANYAKLARAGIAGIKAGNRSSLVAIGETSSNGRDKKKPGVTDTVAPATFMKGVAAALKGVRFDAWAHHPYPFPVNQKPTQLVRYPNVTLKSMPRFEKDLDAAFRRKNIPIWITEYGNETKPGEPKGVTEAQQAVYIPQAIGMARKDARVQMFVWFVMQDSQGSLWQSGIYRLDATPKRAQPAFARTAAPLDPVNGKMTVRGGTKNPKITVYLREYCANNPAGATVGFTIRSYLKTKLVQVSQGAAPLGIDCTVAAARDEAHGGEEEDLPRHRDGEHGHDGRGSPHDHHRRRVALVLVGAGRRPAPTISYRNPTTADASILALLASHGAEGDRTPDLCDASAALSQLSYGPKGVSVTVKSKSSAQLIRARWLFLHRPSRN